MSFATLKAQLAADKKKSVILSVLLAVLLAVIVRAFVADESPAEAEALIPPASTSVSGVSTPTVRPTTVSIGGASAAVGPNSSSGAGNYTVVRPKRTSSKKIAVDGMSREIVRDPFVTPSWSRFPQDSQSTVQADGSANPAVESGPGILDSIRKQFSLYQDARRQTVRKFDAEIDGLELQSTMTGQNRSAYISGRLVHEGDEIDGFTVVNIREREVHLSKGGIHGRLRMK
ncbi:MAG: hypothetical protein KF841_05825 [Phycisphaerae bacterium]|nr:hypothetical protein [Phycisphaerae bacterium]